MNKTIHNIETGELVVVELTKSELTDLEKIKIEQELRKKTEEEKAVAKAALLERLGITADEAALLLG
jgi:hypothetical protein